MSKKLSEVGEERLGDGKGSRTSPYLPILYFSLENHVSIYIIKKQNQIKIGGKKSLNAENKPNYVSN